MPRFFVAPFTGDTVTVTGENAHHIHRVLRMREGENLTLCDSVGTDYLCRIVTLSDKGVTLQVRERTATACEPTTAVTLYQGLPKSDKMEWIIQKSVEIGIARIVPVAMARSVVKLSAAEGEKKQQRWQKIAVGAAQQSGRGCISQVAAPVSFEEALRQMKTEYTVTFYEGGGQPLSSLVGAQTRQVSMLIGPEGGIDTSEIERLQQNGAHLATLGKRILRCETAPLVALSVIMQLTENLNL